MTDAALTLDKLTKVFDKVSVLKGISATVMPGEVIGLLGLNGAGKTTLLETALGFSVPDAGQALIFGQPGTQMDGATKIRIGFVPQREELLEGMKGSAYLELLSTFYPDWDHALVARLSAQWNINLGVPAGKLSVGQRQKLAIISALAYHPDLIILDEPVASLDPVARRQFLKEMVDIASTRTCAIIFSTHIVTDLERVASRIWLMQNGELSIDASMDQLKETIVRVQLNEHAAMPEEINGAQVLHSRKTGTQQILLIQQWSDKANTILKQAFGAGIEIDHLSLEDLFLELHA